MDANVIRSLGEYNGFSIRVNPSDETYINATDMAKACGKDWFGYYRNSNTKEFLDALSAETQIRVSELVIVSRGGDPQRQGTWVHRHVAIDFAQWLSPQFKVWCIQRLDELMRTGRVVIHREHQEAALTEIIPMLQQTLIEAGETRRQLVAYHKQNQEVLAYSIEVLKQMQRTTHSNLEKLVAWQLQKQWGGVVNVPACNGMYQVDLLTDDKIVEIKIAREWKHGFGQVNLYRRYFPQQDPYLHLFCRPLDKLPNEKKRTRIERECRMEGVTVTWHQWEVEIFERVERQPFLKHITDERQ